MALAPKFREVVLEWADDEFVVGHQLSKLIETYLDLEEAVAIGSLSQDELAHARRLYALAGVCSDRLDGEDAKLDEYVFERSASEYRSARLAEVDVGDDFGALVVKMALYDEADRIRVELAATAGSEELAIAAGVMASEERWHREHWWDWVTLLARTGEGRARLQRALERFVPLSSDLFEDGKGRPWSVVLTGEAAAPNPAVAWHEVVRDRIEAAGLTMPSLPATPATESGRRGQHSPDLAHVVESLSRVRGRGEPEVVWG